MDKQTQLIPFLKELGQELEDTYERLNWGGCCVMAGLIGEHLQNFTDVNVVVFNGWGESVSIPSMRDDIIARMGDTNSKDEWDAEGCGWGHVLLEVEIDGTFYLVDSEGVHESAKYNSYKNRADGFLTVNEAQELGGDSNWRGWNRDFDRGQIPQIEETINDAFERFAKEVLS